MNAERAETCLTILFRLNAILLTSAALTIFLPNNLMASIHSWIGLGEMPQTEITEYLTRSCSMMYAIHGVILMVVSFNLRKYRDLVPVLIILHMALGLVVLGIDIKAGMPWYWTVGEGPGILVFACLLMWLWRRAGLSNTSSSRENP